MVASVRIVAASRRRAAQVGLKAMPPAIIVALSLALSGCGDTSIGSTFMNFMPGAKPAAGETDPDAAKNAAKYAPTATCPGAEIRYGTESVNIYEPNKPNTADTIRYQINVQRVARDCDSVGDNIVARVGAAGLVVGGPKGVAGKVSIPVRIAAVSGDKVLYTGLKVVTVDVAAPDYNANWSIVDEAINIPVGLSSDTIIYVGIDDKSKPASKEPAAKPRPRKPKPEGEAPGNGGSDPYPQMKPNIPQ
jgi:hypothetical protein